MRKYTVGRAVRDARVREGFGVRELARMSGVSAGQISRIENGEVEAPEGDTLLALAAALDRPFEALDVLAKGGMGAPQLDTPVPVARTFDPDENVDPAVREFREAWHQFEQGEPVEGEVMDPWSRDLLQEHEELALHFAYDCFVHLTSTYVLEWTNLDHLAGDEMREIVRFWNRLTPERQDQALLYLAEQAALSNLDLRGSNPTAIRGLLELTSDHPSLAETLSWRGTGPKRRALEHAVEQANAAGLSVADWQAQQEREQDEFEREFEKKYGKDSAPSDGGGSAS